MNLKKLRIYSLALASVLGFGAHEIMAQGETPSVLLTVSDDVFDVPLTPTEKGWTFSWQETTSEWSIDLRGTLNPDPSISYGLNVTDFGAPSSFAFFFFTPIVPTGPGTSVAASIVGGLTDDTGDGVSITPFGQPKVQTSDVYFPATTMGVDVGDAAAHPAVVPPVPTVYGYGPFTAGVIAGPVGLWTGLSATAAFTLSGGGDIAALTGFARVDTAATVPDGGAGLVGLAALMSLALASKRVRS